MSVSRIHDYYVNLRLHQSIHALQAVRCNADRSAAEETSLGIFCLQRIFDLLLDIFDRDETF